MVDSHGVRMLKIEEAIERSIIDVAIVWRPDESGVKKIALSKDGVTPSWLEESSEFEPIFRQEMSQHGYYVDVIKFDGPILHFKAHRSLGCIRYRQAGGSVAALVDLFDGEIEYITLHDGTVIEPESEEVALEILRRLGGETGVQNNKYEKKKPEKKDVIGSQGKLFK